MTQVSSDLAFGATRASCEADFEAAPIGRHATGLFNTIRDRTSCRTRDRYERVGITERLQKFLKLSAY